MLKDDKHKEHLELVCDTSGKMGHFWRKRINDDTKTITEGKEKQKDAEHRIRILEKENASLKRNEEEIGDQLKQANENNDNLKYTLQLKDMEIIMLKRKLAQALNQGVSVSDPAAGNMPDAQ